MNLTVMQQEGYATLKWAPVPGATDYQIERTIVDSADQPTDSARISGVWRPNRQIKQEAPSFADAGFVPGVRLRWRVRARIDTVSQPFSDPVVATTMARPGPAEFITGFESTQVPSIRRTKQRWTGRAGLPRRAAAYVLWKLAGRRRDV